MASAIPFEKTWWGYKEVVTFDTGEDKKGDEKKKGEMVTRCNYCVAGATEEVELLYMPLSMFKKFVFPSQDLAFSTERCRSILKILPRERKVSDLSYLLNNVLKSHSCFQQMTLAARTKLATNMTIGFIDEGEVSESVRGCCLIRPPFLTPSMQTPIAGAR